MCVLPVIYLFLCTLVSIFTFLTAVFFAKGSKEGHTEALLKVPTNWGFIQKQANSSVNYSEICT